MGHRAAEGSRFRRVRVDWDPLVASGRVDEQVNLTLGDGAPSGFPKVATDGTLELVDVVERLHAASPPSADGAAGDIQHLPRHEAAFLANEE